MQNIGHFTVTVRKADLLKALRENLERHIAEFETAFRGYRNLCIKELRRRASKIKADKAGDPNGWMIFGHRPPVSHERDYRQLIDMLEMATEEEFEINGRQFRQWIKDEWDWKEEFAHSNRVYSVHS